MSDSTNSETYTMHWTRYSPEQITKLQRKADALDKLEEILSTTCFEVIAPWAGSAHWEIIRYNDFWEYGDNEWECVANGNSLLEAIEALEAGDE